VINPSHSLGDSHILRIFQAEFDSLLSVDELFSCAVPGVAR
jgi:hypothetical protein